MQADLITVNLRDGILKPLISVENAVILLNRVGCSPRVIKHCIAVSKLASKLAMELLRKGIEVDLKLVKIGALLHDIGRSQTHSICHAIVGADIARTYNLPVSIIQIIERHIGSGIPACEARELGLPSRDFIPETLEEKIVTYTDNLVEGGSEISFEKAFQKFANELGEAHAMLDRFKQIHIELQQLGSDY